MKDNTEHIEDLIGKLIVGEASDSEIRELREWRALSSENQKYLDDALLIYEKSQLPESPDFDIESAWIRVKSQIGKKKGQSRFLLPSWGIAAGLTLLFAVSFLFYRQWSKPQEFQFMADQTMVTEQMPDLTEISLNQNSDVKVSYNERKKTGRIQLNGEALISIPETKKVNWIVEAGELQIEDIGTVFHVKAFADSVLVEVTVQEGIVRFFKDGNDGLTLYAGEKGTYDKASGTFYKTEADPNVAAFKTRAFVFQEEPLGRVLERLSSVYDRRFVMEGDISNCKLTVAFENEELETILSVIAETLGLEVKYENNLVRISGDGCY